MGAAASRRLCSVFFFFFLSGRPFIKCLLFAMHSAVSQRCFWIVRSWPDFSRSFAALQQCLARRWEPRSRVIAACECSNCLRTHPLSPSAVYTSLPAHLPRRAFSPVPVLKEKHLWRWCITHRALHPPHPRALTHRQRLAVVFNFMMRREKKKNSRQNTSSRGGTTEHGNSCGPAVSQVQGISLCAWSQDCLHLYELLQLCPGPGSHFIYTLIGLRCN